jgi:hypothetical protein
MHASLKVILALSFKGNCNVLTKTDCRYFMAWHARGRRFDPDILHIGLQHQGFQDIEPFFVLYDLIQSALEG